MLNFIRTFNANYLAEMDCYLAGDAAIHMLTNQYREPTELQFVFASRDGYATFINSIEEDDISSLFLPGMAPKLLRDMKGDMHGRYAWVEFDGNPIKISFQPEFFLYTNKEPGIFPVDTLSKEELIAQKLRSLNDHNSEPALLEQDIQDLMEMQRIWGEIQHTELERVERWVAQNYLKGFKNVDIQR